MSPRTHQSRRTIAGSIEPPGGASAIGAGCSHTGILTTAELPRRFGGSRLRRGGQPDPDRVRMSDQAFGFGQRDDVVGIVNQALRAVLDQAGALDEVVDAER